MTEKVSKSLDEKYYVIDHKSGLKIYVMPKENYSSTYAIFGTNYGSIDTKFKRSDKDEWTVVPEGIAHFLEHKLFESEDLDAFARYAKPERLQTHILRLTELVIFFSAVIILKLRLKYCLILLLILILQRKPLKKSKVL